MTSSGLLGLGKDSFVQKTLGCILSWRSLEHRNLGGPTGDETLKQTYTQIQACTSFYFLLFPTSIVLSIMH